jgi:hypothetical protein
MRYLPLQLPEEIKEKLKDKKIKELYFDNFMGWFCAPHFIQVYEEESPYLSLSDERRMNDEFGVLFKDKAFLQKFIDNLIFDHNFEKEQKLTEEGNQPSNSRVALIQKLLNSKSNSFQMFQQFISFILKNG